MEKDKKIIQQNAMITTVLFGIEAEKSTSGALWFPIDSLRKADIPFNNIMGNGTYDLHYDDDWNYLILAVKKVNEIIAEKGITKCPTIQPSFSQYELYNAIIAFCKFYKRFISIQEWLLKSTKQILDRGEESVSSWYWYDFPETSTPVCLMLDFQEGYENDPTDAFSHGEQWLNLTFRVIDNNYFACDRLTIEDYGSITNGDKDTLYAWATAWAIEAFERYDKVYQSINNKFCKKHKTKLMFWVDDMNKISFYCPDCCKFVENEDQFEEI